MKNFLIVYHSQSGTCARLAHSALCGAQLESEVHTRLLRATDASVKDLEDSGAVLLIAAENSGALAGAMKDFLDRVFYPAVRRELVLPYALIVSAGNDGRGAQREVERIMTGIPFTQASATTILRGEFDEEKAALCQEAGQALAAGLSLGIF